MANTQKLGWIGMGRMGFSMAERLIKAGHDVTIWNRTRAKAEPLAAKGGKVVNKPVELGGVDVLFSIVSAGKDLKEVLFETERCRDRRQDPADHRRLLDHRSLQVGGDPHLKERGSDFVASPVSGNAKVIKAGTDHDLRPGSGVQGRDAAG